GLDAVRADVDLLFGVAFEGVGGARRNAENHGDRADEEARRFRAGGTKVVATCRSVKAVRTFAFPPLPPGERASTFAFAVHITDPTPRASAVSRFLHPHRAGRRRWSRVRCRP